MINAAESFSYRNLTSRAAGASLRIYTSEFSTINAIAGVTQLKALLASDHPGAKRKAQHLLKTAAILSQLGGSTQYKQYLHPRITALAMAK
jgi:hypothetical protein